MQIQIPDLPVPEGKTLVLVIYLQGGPKTDPQFFGDNFGNSAPILTILSLLQAEIYGA